MAMEFQFGIRGGGCTTIGRYIMPPDCTLAIVRMANFV